MSTTATTSLSQTALDPERIASHATTLAQVAAGLAQRGMTPATSSNFSLRLDAHHALITVSGRDKGQLGPDDFMVVDLEGRAVGSDLRPSAETGLHTQLYRRFADVGCVLHTHSHNQTVASRLLATQGHLRLEGYELLKAFTGKSTHETAIDLPILANSQDIPSLAHQVETLLDTGPLWGYLIEGHGLYAWGRDAETARRHMDAFEFLLGCELDLRRLQALTDA